MNVVPSKRLNTCPSTPMLLNSSTNPPLLKSSRQVSKSSISLLPMPVVEKLAYSVALASEKPYLFKNLSYRHPCDGLLMVEQHRQSTWWIFSLHRCGRTNSRGKR